jgi:hypothetical protein
LLPHWGTAAEPLWSFSKHTRRKEMSSMWSPEEVVGSCCLGSTCGGGFDGVMFRKLSLSLEYLLLFTAAVYLSSNFFRF